MKTIKLAAVLIACAVITSLALSAFSPEAFAAIVPVQSGIDGHAAVSWLQDAMALANPALLALRAQRDDLTARAAAKIAEVKDDTPTDDARRIEGEHGELLRELERVNGEIATMERADAARSPTTAPAPDLAAERARSAEIMDLGTRAGMAREDIDGAVRSGQTVEEFRRRAFDHMAARASSSATSSVRVERDETETRRAALSEALSFRIGGVAAVRRNDEGRLEVVRALSGPAQSFARHGLAEMAAEVLGERSMPRSFAEREEVLRRAFHTTTDFPIIFEGSINRVLQARYIQAQPTYRRISVQRNFVDFRPHDVVRVGDFPMLQPVGEGGKIKFGTFGEAKETVVVAPYAVQFALTRQMLVNDHLGAIDQVLGSYGDTVALFEEQTFYAMKGVASGLGPTLKEDNKTVFHADHGNLAGAGTVIDVANLGKARAAMRKQKNMSGAPINVAPRILLVGPDKETEAEQVTSSIQPQQAGNVNPFSGRLEVVATAQVSGNAWELYAEPSALPVFQWGLLEGYTAPRMRIENPFGVSGVGISLEHDFGCGAIDFRGAYRNPGAAG